MRIAASMPLRMRCDIIRGLAITELTGRQMEPPQFQIGENEGKDSVPETRRFRQQRRGMSGLLAETVAAQETAGVLHVYTHVSGDLLGVALEALEHRAQVGLAVGLG